MTLPVRIAVRRAPLAILLALALAVSLGVAACGGGVMRVGAVNPRPRVVVGANAPRYALDVSRVRDVIYQERVTVRDVQLSLLTGFRNAVGAKFAPQPGPDTVTLVIDGVEADTLRDGGRTIALRYAGKWIAPNGQMITPFQGIAMPVERNLSGKKNVEDVMGVMFERMVAALAEAQSRPAPVAPPPTDATPRLPPSAPPVEPRLPPNKPPGT